VRVAVVGHVEWIEFARVEHVPAAGEIVHAEEVWEEPGGGGAVAAVQLAKLAGDGLFVTALGDDELGHRAHRELTALGLRVEAVFRPEPQRRGFVYVDRSGERTITVIGDRMGPRGSDALPWDELADVDALYFTAGDAATVRAARSAHTLVASVRGIGVLREAAVELDALLASGKDVGERYSAGDLEPPPRAVARTSGSAGGAWESADGHTGSWEATSVAGPVADAYGCGDSFAAGFTFGLADGRGLRGATELGARCGAACLAGKGPYAGQLTRAGL